MTETDDEFSGIPDMPSDDDIRAELLRTGSIEHWNPTGSPNREPIDLASLSETARARVVEARVIAGPGPNATPWQRAIHAQYQRMAELEQEQSRILAQLDEVRGYDPETGKPIPMLSSPERRKALSYRLAEIADDKARIEGEPGQRKLEKELAKAVVAEKRRIKHAYMIAEAKRRAAVSEMDAEIDRLADGFRKTQPKR